MGKGAHPLLDLLQSPFMQKSQALMERWMRILMTGQLKPVNWPKPLVHMKDYESNPGVWVFKDRSGITFIVYSDEHRKNAYKGTSIEVQRPEHLTARRSEDEDKIRLIDHACASAISRLFDKLLELSK